MKLRTLALFTVAAIAFAAVTVVDAQRGGGPPAGRGGRGMGPGGPGQGLEFRLPMLTRALDLNAEQQAAVEKIITAEDARTAPLRDQIQELHEKLADAHQAVTAEIAKTLTPEQAAKFLQLHQGRRGGGGPRGGGQQ